MNHEKEVVRAFIVPTKRHRYLDFVSTPRKRNKLIRELAHFKDIDPRYKKFLPPSRQHPADIATMLTSKGAPLFCWVISEYSEIDAREMLLADALQETVGRQMGTIISCVPGRLGFIETEDERCVLERPDYRPDQSRFVRFVARAIDEDSGVEQGIFVAIHRLLDSSDLSDHERNRLIEHLAWFNDHLPVPKVFSGGSNKTAICWFKCDAKASMDHIWSAVQILKDYGVPITMITSAVPGHVIYEDQFQLVAQPYRS